MHEPAKEPFALPAIPIQLGDDAGTGALVGPEGSDILHLGGISVAPGCDFGACLDARLVLVPLNLNTEVLTTDFTDQHRYQNVTEF